jgi:hypothetical protein
MFSNTNIHQWVVAIGIVALGTGCTFSPLPQATPTAAPLATRTTQPTPTTVPTTGPTSTVTPTPTPTPQTLVQPTNTPLPPSATPTATDTPGPFLHALQQNETLGFIIQQYGHDYSNDAINAVVAANDNIFNADILPPVGTIILVPRPTEIVLVPDGNTGENGESPIIQPTRIDGPNSVHIVQEGESIIDIAQQYRTTLEIISQLNPPLNFSGCNFNIPSGGPDCNPFISIGQEIIVPAPTPTPTLSPTPSGNETATPTPTYVPPIVIFPPDAGTVQGSRVRLQWVSSGILAADEVYLVYVKNLSASGEPVNAFVSTSNTFDVPVELAPQGAGRSELQWWVSVGKLGENGQYTNIGGEPSVSTFFWEG